MDRRKFLARMATGFAAIGAVGLSIPFIRSLFPQREFRLSLDIDVSDMKSGEARIVNWLGRQVYLVQRDQNHIEQLGSLDESRHDPLSDNSDQPEFAENQQRSSRSHLVVFTNCTHLGCEVELIEEAGRFTGFQCPCHQSFFDTAGRVRKGSAAKKNLEVPDYQYAGGDTIRLFEARS